MIKNIEYQFQPFDNYKNTYEHTRNPDGWYGLCLENQLRKNSQLSLNYFNQKIKVIISVNGEITVSTEKDGPLYHKIINNILFAWYSAGNLAPFFQIPEIPELSSPTWTTRKSFSCAFRTHIQELRENFCDSSHFTMFHAQKRPPQIKFMSEGPIGTVESVLSHYYLNFLRFKSTGTMFGPGFMTVRLHGILNSLAFVLTTPINDSMSELRFFTVAQKPAYFPFLGNVMSYILRWTAYRDLKKEGDIWNHKIYLKNNISVAHERAILEFRKWNRQFYPQ